MSPILTTDRAISILQQAPLETWVPPSLGMFSDEAGCLCPVSHLAAGAGVFRAPSGDHHDVFRVALAMEVSVDDIDALTRDYDVRSWEEAGVSAFDIIDAMKAEQERSAVEEAPAIPEVEQLIDPPTATHDGGDQPATAEPGSKEDEGGIDCEPVPAVPPSLPDSTSPAPIESESSGEEPERTALRQEWIAAQQARADGGMTLGQRIRRLREERGWKLSDLAQQMGVKGGASHLSRIEANEAGVSLAWLERASAAFGLSVTALLAPVYGEEQPPTQARKADARVPHEKPAAEFTPHRNEARLDFESAGGITLIIDFPVLEMSQRDIDFALSLIQHFREYRSGRDEVP